MSIKNFFKELLLFFIANVKASIFGAYLLFILLISRFIDFEIIAKYDFIFIAAVLFQAIFLIFKFEKLKEFAVILIFHIVATGMELFKTNPQIGSWSYPDLDGAFFTFLTVPLFTGFLYSSVGSYISRAQKYLNLRYENMPKEYHLWIAAFLVYANFFTHHYIYDLRYVILAYLVYIFWKTTTSFKVYKKRRSMHMLTSSFLVSIFMWIAENIGTATKTWLYPSQTVNWHMVSFAKMGSWFLLLILSFALVSIIYREKVYKRKTIQY